jgi:copper chaperone
MTDVTFRVPDMSCGHCKAAVEGELNKLSGVESSNANVETGAVEVSYDETGWAPSSSRAPSKRPATRWPLRSGCDL